MLVAGTEGFDVVVLEPLSGPPPLAAATVEAALTPTCGGAW